MKPKTMLLRVNELPTPRFEDNPNKMTDVEFALLKEAMSKSSGGDEILQDLLVVRHGADNGVIDYEVVDGAHRLEAARELGWETIMCKVVLESDGWDRARIVAYRLGLNRNRGRVDLGMAAAIVTDLKMDGWSVTDMVVTGFTADEIAELTQRQDDEASLLADAGATDVEDDASPADKPFVLEIAFRDRDEFKLCKRKLLKAAGKTKELSRGLLAVLGEGS
jgi:hypothetical protein